MKVYNVFIGCPAYKWPIHPMNNRSVQECMSHPGLHVDYRAIIGDAHIERARAMVLYLYLHSEDKWDFFLNVDWDIEFRPEDVYRMCQLSEQLDRPALGGPYTFKTEMEGKNKEIVFRHKPGCKPDEYHHLQSQYLGGGFTMLRDDLIRKLCKEYPELQFNANPDMQSEQKETYALWNPIIIPRPDWGPDSHELLSEDYSLCARITQIGVPMYMDLCTLLKHWDGDKCYTLNVQEVKKAEEENDT